MIFKDFMWIFLSLEVIVMRIYDKLWFEISSSGNKTPFKYLGLWAISWRIHWQKLGNKFLSSKDCTGWIWNGYNCWSKRILNTVKSVTFYVLAVFQELLLLVARSYISRAPAVNCLFLKCNIFAEYNQYTIHS